MSKPTSVILIGKLRKAGFQVIIENGPAMSGYHTKPFFIAVIDAPGKQTMRRQHNTIREVKETYSKFFDISGLDFGLALEGTE